MFDFPSARAAHAVSSWQDVLLSFSQALLVQRDVASLLQLLESSAAEVSGFDRINLLLPDPHTHQPCLHYRPGQGKGAACLDSVQLADSPAAQIFATQRALCCSGRAFRADYPKSASLLPYRQMEAYALLPLTTARQFLGGIEFIKSAGTSFTEKELQQFKQLAQLVAPALENILEHSALLVQDEQMRKEREHYRILVEVTNTALSKLQMKDLASEISAAIQRYFGFDFISLDLCDLLTHQLRTYSVLYQHNGNKIRGSEVMSMTSSLSGQVVLSQQQTLLDRRQIEALAQKYSLVGQLAERGFQMILALPLISGDRARGVLKLGHYKPYVFSPDKLKLLEQIAARLAIVLDNALAYEEISSLKDKLASENLYLNEEIRNYGDFGEIIGKSHAIATVLKQVEMVASSDCTVLILGETGTGKELIARAIHQLSGRNKNTMVKMNCAAVPSGLLESDLFGHEKGAFTGAAARRLGRFELAHNSTLFLDEVGDLPLELQPKLLRVLQEREIERLGGQKVIPVDARVIAATNCDLKQMVNDKQFRSDLYYRLNVFPIVIPPLRERPEDIPQLVKFFTQKFSRRMNRAIDSIPSESIARLSQMPWPGNVRELENIIERAVILTQGSVLRLPLDELERVSAPPERSLLEMPSVLTAREPIPPLPAEVGGAEDSESERQRIVRVLRETNGIVAGPKGAAARLGLKRTTLLSRMQRMGISVKNYDSTESVRD